MRFWAVNHRVGMAWLLAGIAVCCWLASGTGLPRSAAEVPQTVVSPASEQMAPPTFSLGGLAEGGSQEQVVAELIATLGHPRYVARRAAEQQLLLMGMPAFDQIDAATDHVDPEIAASCRYLVSNLMVRWTRRDDPPQVKTLLEGYADQEPQGRLGIVRKLGDLPEELGLAALCRICRYDPTPEVAASAAIELLQLDHLQTGWRVEAAACLLAEIGQSVRPAAEWVRLLALQLKSPQQAIPLWYEAIARYREQPVSSNDVVSETTSEKDLLQQLSWLQWNLFRLELQQGNAEGMLMVLDQLLTHPGVDQVAVLEWGLRWVFSSDYPELVENLLERYQEQLSATKQGLYAMAVARVKQQQEQQAERLAEAAFELEPGVAEEGEYELRFRLARKLIEQEQVEWGRRELRYVLEHAQFLSESYALACVALADSFHDWQLDSRAAEVLTQLTTKLQQDASQRAVYSRMSNRPYNSWLPSYDELVANEHFYRAGDYRAQGKKELEWRELQTALKYDRTNADIHIALYRATEGEEAKRPAVLKGIERRCRELEREMEEHSEHYVFFNEWAWLVSNTTGDFQKAIRCSQQSLQLFPDAERNAGLLDTLAHCYYAAGEFELAVETQQQAVAKSPYLRGMQRQLEVFEQALATQRINQQSAAMPPSGVNSP